MKKGKRPITYRKQGEPSIDECQELALIYIKQMRKKNVEPTIDSLVKRYLISEEIAEELLSQEQSQERPDHDIYPPTKMD